MKKGKMRKDYSGEKVSRRQFRKSYVTVYEIASLWVLRSDTRTAMMYPYNAATRLTLQPTLHVF